ncbi:MAG: hypothetical protein EA389_08650 [Ilumatobacter sp.]|nr:MAG: hypothetical protein EA389_08650 [Ilumatobacter sp.]
MPDPAAWIGCGLLDIPLLEPTCPAQKVSRSGLFVLGGLMMMVPIVARAPPAVNPSKPIHSGSFFFTLFVNQLSKSASSGQLPADDDVAQVFGPLGCDGLVSSRD